ncbi:winged helix-turn-helix domain-containing protein [bacterium]|nr:winged helix-turn-helix domain-containing protein [bacterium]
MKKNEITRVIQQTPFSWQEKEVLRCIRMHLDESSLLNSALALYLVLTEIASNQQTEKFPASYAKIAQMTGISRRSAIRIMREFEILGIVNVKRRKEGNRNLNSVYTLLSGDSQSLVPGTKTGKLSPLRRIKEESVEESIEANALFDQFWDSYPKKKSKKPARIAFIKIDPDSELFDRMMGALIQQKESTSWLESDGKFIPYPATWLNQARWEDEIEENPSCEPSGVDWGALDL